MNHFTRRTVGALAALCLATLSLVNCSSAKSTDEKSATTDQDLVACSTFSNGAFAVLYSNATADWDTIIAQAPAFVILGDDVGASSNAPSYFHTRNSAIKVITYIPMNQGNNGSTFNPQCGITNLSDGPCTNSPKSWNCGQVAIQSRISTAMASGYDGVFFDETPNNKPNYVASCASSVKGYGANKLVILNPGDIPPANTLFDNNVDIVSVEHDNATSLAALGVPSWRLMSAEDGVSSGTTATSRLSTFRSTGVGGFWYYGASDLTHIPSFFATEIAAAKPGVPNCGGTGGGGLVPIGIHSFNRANNAVINGLYTTISTTSGTLVHAGFTGDPDYMIAPGTYKITAANYYPPNAPGYTFHHWDDNSTAQPRTVTVPASPSGLWVGAWYTVQ